jgi:thymidylate kinase
MAVKIFLLGRSGSGKTTAFQYCCMMARDRGWSVARLRDYEYLRWMFEQEINHKRFRETKNNGFDVIDYSLFDEASRWLENKVKQHLSAAKDREFVFIELARDDYSLAMKRFSPEFLRDSYFLFVEASVEICVQRIQERIKNLEAADHHFVSDTILKTYFAKDNMPYMSSFFKIDYSITKLVETIANDGSPKEFIEKTDEFMKKVLGSEGEAIQKQALPAFDAVGAI